MNYPVNPFSGPIITLALSTSVILLISSPLTLYLPNAIYIIFSAIQICICLLLFYQNVERPYQFELGVILVGFLFNQICSSTPFGSQSLVLYIGFCYGCAFQGINTKIYIIIQILINLISFIIFSKAFNHLNIWLTLYFFIPLIYRRLFADRFWNDNSKGKPFIWLVFTFFSQIAMSEQTNIRNLHIFTMTFICMTLNSSKTQIIFLKKSGLRLIGCELCLILPIGLWDSGNQLFEESLLALKQCNKLMVVFLWVQVMSLTKYWEKNYFLALIFGIKSKFRAHDKLYLTSLYSQIFTLSFINATIILSFNQTSIQTIIIYFLSILNCLPQLRYKQQPTNFLLIILFIIFSIALPVQTQHLYSSIRECHQTHQNTHFLSLTLSFLFVALLFLKNSCKKGYKIVNIFTIFVIWIKIVFILLRVKCANLEYLKILIADVFLLTLLDKL